MFEKRAVTDDEGRFELSLMDNDAPLDKSQRPLLAYKPGYGLAWAEIVEGQVPPDLTLRLVEDRPVRGRVTDTEGRHIAGAKVTVTMISASRDGSLDDFLATWGRQWRGAREKLQRQLYAARLLPLLKTMTDQDGRFELSGIGTERVASLNIFAPGLVSEELQVVNREGFDAEKYRKAAQANMLPQMRMSGVLPRLVGAVFDHIAETELVVRGTVFTGPDRKPVARAIVGSSGSGTTIGGGNNPISANTDETGHFELRGLRRSQDARLGVYGPKDSNLIFRSLQLDLAPGQTVVDVDVEMKEGIFVEGRVFDQATGRGVKSGVQFMPLPENEYAAQPGYGLPKNVAIGPKQTDDDGRFRVLAIPGPGVLMAQVQSGRPRIEPIPYRQASFSEEDGKRVTTTVNDEDRWFAVAGNMSQSLARQNAVKVLDLALDSGPVTCDLPLDPGKTGTITIEDEQGQPVTDAVVSGVADKWLIAFKMAEPKCTIYGLGADRPRHVCVLQPERHLAASLTLTGDEQGPVTVRLGAAASLVGRALDPDGEPLADALVEIYYPRHSAQEVIVFVTRDPAPLKTDTDGRFVVENVLPGERLSLGFRQGDKSFAGPRVTDEQRQLAAGEKLDLGDFKVKQ
ncbi:MAG TPA: carboxypeptidase-like regulatory domain-containing protein [Pirellulales bacterium]|nr:carboxypeptidase-like regulatory domain-containing protein [Pirellulales bacterium]